MERQLETVRRNLAFAEDREQYQAISTVFEQLKKRQGALLAEIAAAEKRVPAQHDVESEVRAALRLADRLTEVVAEGGSLSAAREVFDRTNARLFLAFQRVRIKKRAFNKVIGGVVTFGTAPPPIAIYQGPTARKKLQNPTTMAAAGSCELDLPPPPERCIGSGEEGKSLRNRSGGDWREFEPVLHEIVVAFLNPSPHLLMAERLAKQFRVSQSPGQRELGRQPSPRRRPWTGSSQFSSCPGIQSGWLPGEHQ